MKEEDNKEDFLKQYSSHIKSLRYKLQNSETKIDYLKNEIVQLNNRVRISKNFFFFYKILYIFYSFRQKRK